jgi:thiosulfate/3-mercaptopyruvate sulfurtransferase
VSRRAEVLVGAGELRGLLAAGRSPAILDVRWRLDEPDGRPAYLAGHLPGAVYVSLEDELSDHSRTGRGRHPLPSGSDLQAAARRWGIRRDQPVVVYDDWNRAGSARAWWVLTAAGIPGVRILDGGLSAWTAAGGALQSSVPTPVPGDVSVAHVDLYHGARATLTADQVAEGRAHTLLDARSPERFRGEVEPVDPVAGHIPGARNLPSTALLAGDGTFLVDNEIRALLAERGVGDSAGVYCGSGITAAVVVAGLCATGVDAALFAGSWSQWSAEADRPVATGG